MSATDELRAMLDKRGVEWTNPNSCLRDEMTSWVANGFDYDAFEVPDGTLVLTAAYQDDLTPEQAIAATLGAGTCEDLGGTDANGRDVFNCSRCGCVLSLYDIDGSNNLCTSFIFDYPHFCPECGARVVRP